MAISNSEPRRGEATGPEFGNSQFERLLGVDDTRPGACEKHGDFVDLHCSGKGRVGAGWRGCPTCEREQQEAQQAVERRDHIKSLNAERVERMVRKCGIPKRFLGKTFETYAPLNDAAIKNRRKLEAYAELISGDDHNGRSLILFGKLGNGKTHLACSLVDSVIRATAEMSEYWTFSELVRRVKGSFKRDSGYTEESVYKDFARPRLVVLDEIGVQNFTEFERTVAYEAINARYLEELPTVMITNLNLSELRETVGERVMDRLREGGGTAMAFTWDSFREGGEG